MAYLDGPAAVATAPGEESVVCLSHASTGALHLINRSAMASGVLGQSGEGARPIHKKLHPAAASADTQTPIQACHADLFFPTTSSLVR